MILPVIMAGGSGSRLWPLSRQQFPKQFLTLLGDDSMLQTTAQRLKGIEHIPALVICNEEHRFSVAEQFRANAIKTSGIILEPIGRNTAPAIALAAMQALKSGNDPLLLVLAADHVIKDEAAFCASVEQAVPFAQADKLVTFGIVPTAPETGYGYIKRGDVQGTVTGFTVAQFIEKPNLATAQDYLASGEYYWNSGMFLFKASTYLAELKAYRPDMFSACELAMAATQVDLDFIRVNKAAFEACPDDSVDYAVMEKTTQAVVVPMDCGWSDVGSWSALWDVSDKDEHGNACRGDVINVDTRNTYVHASEKLVTTIGLDNVIVVETKDAILVAKQSEVQQVKKIVEQLKAEVRNEWQHHREVYRPWGKYDSIDNGDRFQVKRITVKPGEKLSIQMHHHRAEHWIVVTGTAKVTNGDKEILLTENQSTYIPVGVVHALENPGKVPLELIEVQSGSYLGEDDIVRFEDRYGRN
ncbi:MULTISPECIES: mannose-1-phosphate guanylyltransferase/mannose-6-phosphate isomerase [Shewanella]|uniref:mannose-1-phosphate guanylyltransferase/mannose-6-phosphate isomerase n=1 Tax=Shewanella TaxID=22 RepID=UPI000C49BB6F|nr:MULTISPECIES: mannose-1-phosphate guanylyltransferase/mannose-6-phosphate isomerase [Shewanella]NCQ44529.1 mannose-1-phosphate guanylyltransferase/mannose-6-phosphate isomerase [Shewanella frigidimarina]NCO72192.1 mannose-1-phosphate guanylyltransferase/mannose-6-phosphate isomerase [Shewanella vesiculosa]NCP35872.1 mannose-1-phosphate guanylyltransferase/mannose-6-phosphate isomerase [Shewanella vesiculosa]NCP68741.1 mannose-1-phosphate guanylyltransferase/mannose-6-phosphate isomerase [She